MNAFRTLTRPAFRPVLGFVATVAFAVASGAAMAADAAQAPKTRAQVRAELIEARAQGTLPMGGEFAGVMSHDAPAAKRQGPARAEVKGADREEARQGG